MTSPRSSGTLQVNDDDKVLEPNSLRWFEPNTCHTLVKRPAGCGNAARRAVLFLSRRASGFVAAGRFAAMPLQPAFAYRVPVERRVAARDLPGREPHVASATMEQSAHQRRTRHD
jgi:hypothetical protein